MSPQLRISEVFIDQENEQIHAIGSGFGSSPSARLGDVELQVLASTDSVLTAALPDLPPGSYRLKISRGNSPSKKRSDVFEVTLGAVVVGPIELNAGEQQVLAASPPLQLVLVCEVNQGSVQLRSNTAGSFAGIRANFSFDEPPEGVNGAIDADGAILVQTGVDTLLDSFATFMAHAGDSTLSGEVRLEQAGINACRASFNGLAG